MLVVDSTIYTNWYTMEIVSKNFEEHDNTIVYKTTNYYDGRNMLLKLFINDRNKCRSYVDILVFMCAFSKLVVKILDSQLDSPISYILTEYTPHTIYGIFKDVDIFHYRVFSKGKRKKKTRNLYTNFDLIFYNMRITVLMVLSMYSNMNNCLKFRRRMNAEDIKFNDDYEMKIVRPNLFYIDTENKSFTSFILCYDCIDSVIRTFVELIAISLSCPDDDDDVIDVLYEKVHTLKYEAYYGVYLKKTKTLQLIMSALKDFKTKPKHLRDDEFMKRIGNLVQDL